MTLKLLLAIARRRVDPHFAARLRAIQAENAEALKRLEG